MEIGILFLFTQPERSESEDWDPASVYTTIEKGEWRLGSCFCLHNQREGRVEIRILLLSRERGEWGLGSCSFYTTREKGEWRLGFRSCLHNLREGRVEIGILLLFTQPERREEESGD